MNPAIAVITNRHSTRNAEDGDWITPLVAGHRAVVHFPFEHAAEVPVILEKCAAMGIDTLAVNGGDGTVGLVFGILLNQRPYAELPAIALLPGGKTNMTAGGWGLPGDRRSALLRLIRAHDDHSMHRYLRERSVLSVHQAPQRAPLYGTFFGAAEVVEGILFCRRHVFPLNLPETLSHAAAIGWLVWRSFFQRAEQRQIAVTAEQEPIETDAFFLIIATVLDEMLLGVRPAPEDTPIPHGLHYMSLRNRAGPIVGTLPSLLHKRLSPGTGRTVRRMERVTLNFTGAYTLDGELYEAHAGQPIILDGTKRLRFVQLPPA